MNSKIKFKIGEFSKLCRVTVKTLRHYEEIGLLVPFEVDEWTGYRHYNIRQLRKMNQIVYLKKLGFSLEEIGDIFEDGRELPDFEGVRVKIMECRQEIASLLYRVDELEKLENNLTKQKTIMNSVIIKTLPSGIFATHRRKIESYQELFNLCPNIIGPEMHRLGCECSPVEYCFTVEYNEEYGVDIDIEFFEAVSKKGVDSDIIIFKELPEVPQALCINHYGLYEKMPETFADLYSYAEKNGYEISGLPRFCYIDGIWNKQNSQEWLTEIQLPVVAK